MALLESCTGLSKSFGSRVLFSGIALGISEGERLGLIGPNGAGKSTLLKILAGRLDSDEGSVSLRRNTCVGYVPQQAELPTGKTATEVIADAIAGERLDDAERASRINLTLGRAGFTSGKPLADARGSDRSRDNAEGASRIDLTLGRAGFTSGKPLADARGSDQSRDREGVSGKMISGEIRTEALSGGWQRRLAIARELALNPDVLFLDEPTNHLDIEGILWLEKLLTNAPFASVVVSHDRYFLDNVVSGMAEIDRAYPEGIFRVPGNYSRFLEKKAEFLLAQSSHQESLANIVRREVEWLRRGAKARTGKSRARTDEAGRLIDELSDLERRTAKGVARIDFTATDRRTKRLISVEGITKSLGGRALFRDLSFTLSPGVRLGLLGLNGTGKTTLLKILAGEAQPDSGRVEFAEALRIVYFDQARERLDPTQTLREGLGGHGDHVIFRGQPIHVAGWAKRFLFDSGQLDRPISSLSGGEQARVLIARLMLQPADILLLDEPTNDLDITTLEVLEESLADFPGALVLVTHDRFMLDRVSTGILSLDGQGGSQIYADYWQWEQAQTTPKQKTEKAAAAKQVAAGKKKLSYLEAREWERMESRILEAEQALEAIRAEMQAPEVASDGMRLHDCYERLQAAEAGVAGLYARWAELEEKR